MKKSIASIAGFLLAASLLGCAQSDIDVPDVVGQKADDAKDVLMDSGFYNVDMVEEDGIRLIASEPSARSARG